MRFALLVVFAIVALARSAHASCAIDAAFVATYDVPLGCPLIVDMRDTGTTPKVVVARPNAGNVDVTGAMTQAPHAVSIFYEDNACTGEGHTSTFTLQRFTIELAGVAVGDTVMLDGVDLVDGTARIVAAGPCRAPSDPSLSCPDDTFEPCDGGDGGCSSTPTPAGPATLALAIALVGLGTLRRRR